MRKHFFWLSKNPSLQTPARLSCAWLECRGASRGGSAFSGMPSELPRLSGNAVTLPAPPAGSGHVAPLRWGCGRRLPRPARDAQLCSEQRVDVGRDVVDQEVPVVPADRLAL